ncbi:MAG: hypothetical protein WCP85_18000 [Mariniphaga sp.]
MATTKTVRDQMLGKEPMHFRTGMANLLKVCGVIYNNVFGTVLLSLGLLCRAGDHLSNSDCAALRAMTGPEGESAVMLFVVFLLLLKYCDAIHNFVCFPKAWSLVVVSSFPKALPLG